MSDRYRTLSRTDPEFDSYLDGSFSKTLVALPVRSLDVGTRREQVTFELKTNSEILKPNRLIVIKHLIRPASLLLSLSPLLATLAYCFAHDLPVSTLIATTAFAGVVLFQISMNLFNDYGDQMSGVDRLRPYGGSRAIQNGWITAKTVKQIAIICLVTAAALGLPAILLSMSRVIFFAIVAALIALEFAFSVFRLKQRGWAEVLAFALLGPMLTIGYAWAVTDLISTPLITGPFALGSVFGAVALLYFHAANFENIMADSKAGARTWATRAGFDASKKFFYFVAALITGLTFTFSVLIEGRLWLLPTCALQLLFIIPLCLRVHALASPLSSKLQGLRRATLWLSAVTVVGFALGYLAYLGPATS